jgi:conjugative relaxase-like TrwC/TraI family protein
MVATPKSLSSANGSTDYFTGDGYYVDGSAEHLETMSWNGAGAEALNLIGKPVTADLFKSIMEGYVPGTDQRIGVKRGNKFIHKTGTDLCLSAPKTVSILALIGGEKEVLEAHRKAVDTTLKHVEKNILETRMIDPETGKMGILKGQKGLFTTFVHDTSRNLDPQTHTHCVISNMCQGEDGVWRAVENYSIYTQIMAIGAFYHNELAANLKTLGYEICKTGKNGMFEVAGKDGTPIFSKEIIEAFSTRSKEIKDAMNNMGLDLANKEMRAKVALMTRRSKEKADRVGLKEMWDKQSNDLGIDFESIDRTIDPAETKKSQFTPESAVLWAKKHFNERNVVFGRDELTAEALSLEIGAHKHDEIQAAIDGLIDKGDLVETKYGHRDGLTTQKELATERENIDMMSNAKNGSKKLIIKEGVDKFLAKYGLTKGQEQAVHNILSNKHGVVGVQGYAGAGKTTMIDAVRRISEVQYKNHLISEKIEFLGFAPSSSAAATLQKESGIESFTLAKFLEKNKSVVDKSDNDRHVQKMKQDVKDKVIIVDEASMISNEEMNKLFKISEKLEARKVVLVGDAKQLDGVNAGTPFAQLQRAGMPTAYMEDIMRQRDEIVKEAVIDFLKGEPAEALKKLDKSVVEVSHDNMSQQIAADWLSLSKEDRDKTAIVAPTHLYREEINGHIREGLILEGQIKGDGLIVNQLVSTRLTEAEREIANNYQPGQVVVFEKDVLALDIDRGDTFVVSRNKDGIVYLKTEDENEIQLDPAGGIAPNLNVYDSRDVELKEGDLIKWTKNDPELELVNSHQAKITNVDKESENITFENEDGRLMTLPANASQFNNCTYAFSLTSHAMQSRTVDHILAIADSTSHMTTQKSAYVDGSRARLSATFYTDDKVQLSEVLEATTGEKITALQAIGEESIGGTRADKKMEDIASGATITEAEHIKHHESVPPEDLPEQRTSDIDQNMVNSSDSKDEIDKHSASDLVKKKDDREIEI